MGKQKTKIVEKGILYQGHVYEKPEWAIKQVISRFGYLEDHCRHGVAHPNEEFLKKNPGHCNLHGCCGCCKINFYEYAI
jgi:hypothetical protein